MSQDPLVSELIREVKRLREMIEAQPRVTESAGIRGSWIPTLWQAGTQIATTLDHASYTRVGDLVFVESRVSAAAAGPSTGLIEIRGLPFAVLNTLAGGSFVYFQTTNYEGTVRATAGSFGMIFTKENSTGDLGVDPAITVANGATFRFFLWYFTS